MSELPSALTIVAGTYDGVLIGWNNEKERNELNMAFAMPAHEGSVRSLSIIPQNNQNSHRSSGIMVSGGFDESLKVYNLKTKKEVGETKTPQDLGTPVCSEFAPPSDGTHMLVGLSSGRIAMYKRSDWSVVHVLGGHEGGVACVSCHPSGKLALSGGIKDGTMRLWDLTKGRLAFVHKLNLATADRSGSNKPLPRVNSICWSADGTKYAFCFDKRVTARDSISGKDLVDIELPARPNQICFLGDDDDCLACACNDGSLPVLGVGESSEVEKGMIRAVMAIEGVGRVVVGDDRFKCIQRIQSNTSKYLVATANSGGTVSVIDLIGAVRALAAGDDVDDASIDHNDEKSEASSNDESGDMEELAEFISSVRVGTGARITLLSVWSADDNDIEKENESTESMTNVKLEQDKSKNTDNDRKRKIDESIETFKLDPETVARARSLVDQAKKIQKKKRKKSKSKD